MAKKKRVVSPDARVMEQFRIGASRVYGRMIKEVIARKVAALPGSLRSVAIRGGFDPALLHKPDLSFRVLVMAMIVLEIKPGDLPKLPDSKVLSRGGWLSALPFTRDMLEKRKPRIELSAEDMECLRLSFVSNFHKVGHSERQSVARRIIFSVGNKAIKRAVAVGGELAYINHLRSHWTDAWGRVAEVIAGTDMENWV